MNASLDVQGLTVTYPTGNGRVIALEDVSLVVGAGRSLGLIGESGSGKSTFINALSGALNGRSANVEGSVTFGRVPILDLRGDDLRRYRRDTLAYIGQDPHGALDPTTKVGRQLAQAMGAVPRDELEAHLAEHLRRVGFPDPMRVAGQYPHQLSGGMAQRVAIAIALARRPSLVIADEPTASLDSTLRTRILDLVTDLVADLDATLIMVSHDLAAVRRYCDETAVMYSGRVVECAASETAYTAPRHPYTAGLLGSAPTGAESAGAVLEGIPGHQQARFESVGCAFTDRCRFSVAECLTDVPQERVIGESRVSCHRANALDLRGW